MAQRVEHHPLDAAFAALLNNGLDGAGEALRILVNEASRIEGLCKPLGRQVLVSSAFHTAAVACGSRMVSVGVHALRGIGEPQELFTLT